jgi:septal ring factor EnvC (AmiA/AmiB activator)
MFGKNGGRSLVVRQRTSALQTALLIAAVLIGLFALYVVYELGRYNAGYDRQAVAQQRTGLEVQIEHLEKANREMRTRLAELDTIRVGRAREQAEVARTMGDLQAQVARQSQELAFYRGVVAQGATTVGVKIEQLRITAGQRPATYIVHMSLVRSGRADAPATGSVQLSLDGTVAESARTLDFATLTAGRQRELRYNFHYLQSFDQELTVPLSFKPERLNVEVSSGRLAPLSQTFLWSVEASP